MPSRKNGPAPLDNLNGQFMVFCHDGNFIGPFETYAEATRAGRKRCGDDDFTVMRLEAVDPKKRPRST